MKREVWKYEIFGLVCQFAIPKGAEILTLEMQKGTPCMWALVDLDAEREKRSFLVVGTGETIYGENIEYIGTFMLQNGNLVFHVFETFQNKDVKSENNENGL